MTIYRVILILLILLPSNLSFGSDDADHLLSVKWQFDGLFGKFDRSSLQRGYQVFKNVCSTCHSMKRVSFRDLKKIGFSDLEIKALSSEYQIQDGPNESGQMFMRTGRPSDYFPGPFTNDNEARAANNGAFPPDLSLIIKARQDGANYVYSILNGYQSLKPTGFAISDGLHYNRYFPGRKIAMATPLIDGIISYQDGTEATIDQMSKDVVNFLQWASEPEMEDRKSMGIKVITFLLLVTVFTYLAMKRIWSDVK